MLIKEVHFTNDAVLFAHTEEEIQKFCNGFLLVCDEFGLTISLRKRMITAKGMLIAPEALIASATLEVVQRFCYLGSSVGDNLILDDKLNSHTRKAALHIWSTDKAHVG